MSLSQHAHCLAQSHQPLPLLQRILRKISAWQWQPQSPDMSVGSSAIACPVLIASAVAVAEPTELDHPLFLTVCTKYHISIASLDDVNYRSLAVCLLCQS